MCRFGFCIHYYSDYYYNKHSIASRMKMQRREVFEPVPGIQLVNSGTIVLVE